MEIGPTKTRNGWYIKRTVDQIVFDERGVNNIKGSSFRELEKVIIASTIGIRER